MGAAKNRGNKEQRVAKAIAKADVQRATLNAALERDRQRIIGMLGPMGPDGIRSIIKPQDAK